MSYITKEGLEKLNQELKELKTVKRREVARRLEEAKAHGDISENAEYQEAKDMQGFIEGRIRQIEKIVKEAKVLDEKRKVHNGEVQIGSKVVVQNGKFKSTYYIVSFDEVDPAVGKISSESPLGKALLEHKKDDEVEVQLPGRKVSYRILKVE